MVSMDVGDEDRLDLHRRDTALLEPGLDILTAVNQERAPTHCKYLGALMSSGGWLGRSRAQNRQSEIHPLLSFLELLLKGGKSIDVTESGLLKVGVDLLDSLLGVVSLGSHLGDLDIIVSSYMREENPAGAPAKLNHLERKGLTDDRLLAVFLDEVAAEREALVLTLKLDVSALVGKRGDGALDCGTDRVLALDLVPRVRDKLLVTKAELVVSLIEVEDDNVNLVTRGNHL